MKRSRPCAACNGSGYYDSCDGHACSSCGGSGKEKFKPEPILPMNKNTCRQIDALHAQIKALIDKEKTLYMEKNPGTDGRSSLLRQIEFTKIEMYRLCPQDRGNMHYAAATFPTLPGGERTRESIEHYKEPCNHHYVMDSEHPTYHCCQLCGKIKKGQA